MMVRLGVLPRSELASHARDLQRRGSQIVFTNGCFDILHLGHVTYLEAARALGDVLFVGVNSDRSVRGLKGRDRPMNGEMDRAGVVAALHAVSAVTLFEDETAAPLVEEIRPDVYVKGGDYSSDPESPAFPIEAAVVRGYGGNVRILPFAAGYSTTLLIDRIKALT